MDDAPMAGTRESRFECSDSIVPELTAASAPLLPHSVDDCAHMWHGRPTHVGCTIRGGLGAAAPSKTISQIAQSGPHLNFVPYLVLPRYNGYDATSR